ncbi:response regulator [Spirulina major]|uniref:response regulator n=1 Tax=Spirulina major TaxID=270636 RepID=UPI000934E317|nr:response regulator [Spirulina major]
MPNTPSLPAAPVVLVVDDHCLLRRLATDLLAFEGFRTIEAACGQEVLDLVNDHQPDVILMDLYLPDVAGVEVCRRLKENHKTAPIPVIFTTVEQSQKSQALSRKVGGSDVMQKPLDRRSLSLRIRALLPHPFNSVQGLMIPAVS